MMIHAYSEDYLNNAQKILGDMMDYAVNTYEFSPNQFYEMFLVSDVSMQFQTGNPTYVAGKTGCELVKEVIRKSGLLIPELEDEMYQMCIRDRHIPAHINPGLVFLGNAVIQKQRQIQERADWGKARLISKAAVVGRQFHINIRLAAPCGGQVC